MQSDSENSPLGFDDIVTPIIPSNTSSGQNEEKDLAAAAEEGKHVRDEGMKNQFHTLFIWFSWVAFGCFAIVFLVRISHLIIPECCMWLKPERIQEIDKLVFSGAIGGFIGKYISTKVKE